MRVLGLYQTLPPLSLQAGRAVCKNRLEGHGGEQARRGLRARSQRVGSRPLLAPRRGLQCQAARRDAPAAPAPTRHGRGAGQKHEASRRQCLSPTGV